jgi:hypothetical protein
MSDTLIVAVMNRQSRTVDAINNWLESPHVKEIVVVDWSSKHPLTITPNEKVLHVRVNDQPKWHLTKAYNFAASFVPSGTLCKMDADYRIDSDFLSKPLEPHSFWRGQPSVNTGNEVYITGFLRVDKTDLAAANGYNERIDTYGYDDIDLFTRLAKTGSKSIGIEYGKIRHIPHDNKERFQAQTVTSAMLSDMNKRNREQCIAKPWTCQDKKSSFVVTKVKERYYTAQEI